MKIEIEINNLTLVNIIEVLKDEYDRMFNLTESYDWIPLGSDIRYTDELLLLICQLEKYIE